MSASSETEIKLRLTDLPEFAAVLAFTQAVVQLADERIDKELQDLVAGLMVGAGDLIDPLHGRTDDAR